MKDNSKMVTVGMVITMVGLVVSAVGFGLRIAAKKEVQYQARKEVVCPSFLSIARSARDTLIVMRNEPLCNDYVLDNLK